MAGLHQRLFRFCILLVLALGFGTQASPAAETVRVGVLKFGTVNWELDTIKQQSSTKNMA